MGFFKNLFRSATNAVGNVMSSLPIPGISGIGDALVSEVGRADAKDQLKSEQNWAANQAELNRQFQTSEREATQKWELEQWEREKEYNTPSNQLKLAMDAGINPNSVFGNSNPFVATSAPSSSPMSGAMASSPGSLASSLLQHDPQVAALMAQTRKTDAEAQGQEIANEFAPKFNEKALQKAQAEIDEIASRKGFTDQQTHQLKEMLPLLKGKSAEEIKKLEQETANLIDQGRLIKANADSAEAQAEFDKWANGFREKYGVAPNSGLIDGLIQLIASEEKGADIASALINTLCSVAAGAVSGVMSLPGRFVSWLFNTTNTDQQDPPIFVPAPYNPK